MKKILVYGPPFAGKLTLLGALAQREAPENIRHARVALPHVIVTGQKICHYLQTAIVRTEIGGMALCTLSREVYHTEIWDPLVVDADGVVLALNSTPDPSWQAGNLVMIENLARVLGLSSKVGCIVCTKSDKRDKADTVEHAVVRAASISGCNQWPVFRTRLDQLDSLITPLNYMIETLIASRARE